MRGKKETLIESAVFIEREANLMKESEILPGGSWPYTEVWEEYQREIQLAQELRDIAQSIEQ